MLLLAGLAPLFVAPRTSPANNLQNIQFTMPADNGRAAEVLGVLGGGDDGLVLRFFDAGKDMAPTGPGHAWLAPVEGTFERMSISTAGNASAMTAIQMNLHASGNGSVTFTATGAGGANTDLALADTVLAENSFTFDLTSNGQNRITFELPDGSPFTQLDMTSDVGIDSIRQVRVAADAAVPEPVAALPAFALFGLALRRRRR